MTAGTALSLFQPTEGRTLQTGKQNEPRWNFPAGLVVV